MLIITCSNQWSVKTVDKGRLLACCMCNGSSLEEGTSSVTVQIEYTLDLWLLNNSGGL